MNNYSNIPSYSSIINPLWTTKLSRLKSRILKSPGYRVRIVCYTLLCLYSVSISAHTNACIGNRNGKSITIYSRVDKQSLQTQKVAQQFFVRLHYALKNHQFLSSKELNRFFDGQIRYTVNHQLIAGNLHQFIKKAGYLFTHSKSIELLGPIEISASGESALVRYQIKFTDKTKHTHIDHITAILHLKKNKIDEWQAFAVHPEET